MNAKHKTVFIAFSSQKGGVGKSTFTTLAASILQLLRRVSCIIGWATT